MVLQHCIHYPCQVSKDYVLLLVPSIECFFCSLMLDWCHIVYLVSFLFRILSWISQLCQEHVADCHSFRSPWVHRFGFSSLHFHPSWKIPDFQLLGEENVHVSITNLWSNFDPFPPFQDPQTRRRKVVMLGELRKVVMLETNGREGFFNM